MMNSNNHILQMLRRVAWSLLSLLALCTPARAQLAGRGQAIDPMTVTKPAEGGPTHDHDDLSGLLNMHEQEIHFTENRGQFSGGVLYRADFPLGQALATREGMLMKVYDAESVRLRQEEGIRQEQEMQEGKPFHPLTWRERGHGWMMHFQNASPEMRVESRDAHEEVNNYFTGGKEALGVHSYQEVWYTGVYHSTDVRYYPAVDGSLEYDIICKPGSDPREIAIEFKGIERLRANVNGELVVPTSLGEMTYPAPVVYQRIGGRELKVEARYTVRNNNVLGFELGAYDKTQPLVIDPIAMRWATWVNTNSTGDNHGHAIWVDPVDGAIYVVARVVGTTDNITVGAFDVTANGNLEIIVGKYLEPATVGGSGTRVWQTYIGGGGDDNPYAMEQGPDGNLYITGQTSSTNFPLIGGPDFTGSSVNQQAQADIDVFVLKINTTGTSIKVAVVGGNGADNNFDVRLAANGDVFVCGSTTSTNLLTLNAGIGASNANNGGADALVFRINQDLSSLVWMRNYGGGGTDRASIMLHNPVSGDLFVGGNTASTNFPTVSPRQATRGGTSAGFLQRMTGAGATTWSSYFSSDAGDDANLLCMEFNDARNEIYFGGVTEGLLAANITAGSFDTGHNGGNDFYVGRMDIDQNFLAGTYVGGTGSEVNMMGLNVDLNNDVFVFGYSNSTNFPVSASPNVPLQSTNQGSNDKVFFKLESNLSVLEFSTYYGGSNDDYDPVGQRGIKFSNCRIYTIVTAQSNNIPLTQGSLNTTKNSPTSRYEPGLVVWANPPDLLGNSITYQGASICAGSVPGNITGSVPSYTLPTIVRNNAASTYPSFPSAATYQWQISTDSLNWNNIAGQTGQNIAGVDIGPVTQTTFIRRIIGGDACILAGAADQVVTVRLMTAGGTVVQPSCNGGSNGTITATADGQAPFTYLWNDAAAQTAETAVGLIAGAYSVTVTDANGCSAVANFQVGQPSAVNGSAQVTNATCGNSNGSATATGSGGTPGYTYAWSTGAIGATLSNVPAGNYSVTITDSHQCSFVLPVVIGGNGVPNANAGADAEITCLNNGQVVLDGSSSTGGVTFSWSGPGIVSGGSTEDVTVNTAGTYVLTVLNSQTGCSNTDAAEVNLNNTLPGAQASGGTLDCNTASVQLSGSGNGTFAWTGPNAFASTEQNPTVSAAGTYVLTVTATNGCTSQALAQVDLDQDAPVISAEGGSLDCETGLLQLNATAFTGVSFVWAGPNGFSSTEEDPIVSEVGTYSLTVNSENGCTAAVAVLVDRDCDTECPPMIIECPAGITLACAEDLSPTVAGEPILRKDKDCPAIIDFGWNDDYLSVCPFVIRRTFFAVDAEGNVETCEQMITVIDEVPPVFMNVPEELKIPCDQINDDMQLPDVWAYDECTKQYLEVEHYVDVEPGACAGQYAIIHIWSATDMCGNTASAAWVITVYDDQAPVIDCKVEDVKVDCKSIPEALKCTATDNCDADVEVVLSEVISEGDCKKCYTIERTYTATDDCGNTTAIAQTIFVCDGDAKNLDVTVVPNPFREDCSISFTAPENGKMVIEVTDLQGRRVSELFDAQVSAGQPIRTEFHPVENGSGMFIYRILLNGNETRGRLMYQP